MYVSVAIDKPPVGPQFLAGPPFSSRVAEQRSADRWRKPVAAAAELPGGYDCDPSLSRPIVLNFDSSLLPRTEDAGEKI